MTFRKFMIYMAVWVCGCAIFDMALHVTGAWMMWAGVFTHVIAMIVSGLDEEFA